MIRYDTIAVLIFMIFFFSGCSENESYGPTQFTSQNAYFAYIIKEPGDKPQMIQGNSDSPTGLGGTFSIPKCHRWGIVLLTPLALDQFVSEGNKCSLPELLIVDNGHFGEEELKKFSGIKTLRRVDFRFCPNISAAVLSAFVMNNKLQEIWLKDDNTIKAMDIGSFKKKNRKLSIQKGSSEAIMPAISEGRSTT